MLPLSRNEIEDRVLNVVSEVLTVDASSVDVDSLIESQLAPDSLDQVRLYMTLEDEFAETIPEEELESIKTVRDIVDYVERAMAS